MPKFTYKYTEAHQVNLIYKMEIDTTDQALWETLLEKADSDWIYDEDQEFPSEAPSDPMEWYRLMKFIRSSEFENQEEDWWTINSGAFDTSTEMTDGNGKIITSE